MTWTTSKTAGLAIGILLLIITVIISATLILRNRTRKAPQKPDPETVATSPEPELEPEPEYSLPGPMHEPGTIRRATGQPQTFYDWVQSSNAEAGHECLPSLDNGPGPSEASSMYSQPRISGADIVVRLGTGDSVGGSSLRKAVLGAGEMKGTKNAEVEKKEHVLKVEEMRAEDQKKTTTRGYSGAWP